MKKKEYSKREEKILSVIPSPEYNRTVTKIVVNGRVQSDGINYKVTNSKDTKEEVRIVLFPDGTANVL